MTVYSNFIHRKPACFGSFDLLDAKEVKSNWPQGPEFITKFVACECGETLLNVYASFENEMHLAPIELECPKCKTRSEVFNPEKHGWDGQNGDSCSLVGESEPKLFNQSPTKVVVEFSYQGEENYEELMNDGIENPEDYFDVFSLYTASEKGKLDEVVSYECA